MTREASAAMRKLVEAFDSTYCAEHEMDLRRKFFGDDWSQDVVEAACASRTALLAAIAAQEAATEAAQAEVARLRAVLTDALAEIEPAIVEGSQRGMGMHVTYTGAFASVARLPSVRRDLDRLAATIRAALKETP